MANGEFLLNRLLRFASGFPHTDIHAIVPFQAEPLWLTESCCLTETVSCGRDMKKSPNHWLSPRVAEGMGSVKIDIRHAEPEDYKAIQQIHAQPRAIWGTLQLPFPSAELWKKRLTEKPDSLYSLVACVENEIVGSLGLWLDSHSPRRRHVGGIGMAVHDHWQGQGVGTALLTAALELADNWLNLVRVELNVYTDNEPAIRLYQKVGFTIEGTLQKYAFREGRYVDAYSMARIKESVVKPEERA